MAKNPKQPTPFFFTGEVRDDEQFRNRVNSEDYFLSNFKTPQDIEEYTNFQLMNEFSALGLAHPFEQVGDYRARFNPNFVIPDTEKIETPEQEAYATIRERLVQNRGGLPEPAWIKRVVGGTMTAGWAKFLTGTDISDMMGDFGVTKDGFTYKGKKLKLNEEQTKTISDYINRNTGADIEDRTFLDKVVETAASLTLDLPLMMITGGVTSGAMRLTQITSRLARATDFLPRMLGQVIQQSVNFNLLGLPQTVEAVKDGGVGGALESIWHSTQMAILASITGTLGTKILKPIGLEVFKRNPALREELGGLTGSFGFGYLSTKAMGANNEEAIATGLGFAATHFTNPKAYQRVIKEQATKDVKILASSMEGNKITNVLPDYFIEKDNKLYFLDTEAFKERGEIKELDVEPIVITDKVRKGVHYYNELPDAYQQTYGDLLERDRRKQFGKLIYEDWAKDLDAQYLRDNGEVLRVFAEMITPIIAGEKLRKTFTSLKLPEDSQLMNKMIKLANDFSLPYPDVKKFVVNNIVEYSIDPEGFAEQFKQSPAITLDLVRVLDEASKAYARKSEKESVVIDKDGKLKKSKKTEKKFPKIKDGETLNEYVNRTLSKKLNTTDEKLEAIRELREYWESQQPKTKETKPVEGIPETEIYTKEELDKLDVNELTKIAENLEVEVNALEMQSPEYQEGLKKRILESQNDVTKQVIRKVKSFGLEVDKNKIMTKDGEDYVFVSTPDREITKRIKVSDLDTELPKFPKSNGEPLKPATPEELRAAFNEAKNESRKTPEKVDAEAEADKTLRKEKEVEQAVEEPLSEDEQILQKFDEVFEKIHGVSPEKSKISNTSKAEGKTVEKPIVTPTGKETSELSPNVSSKKSGESEFSAINDLSSKVVQDKTFLSKPESNEDILRAVAEAQRLTKKINSENIPDAGKIKGKDVFTLILSKSGLTDAEIAAVLNKAYDLLSPAESTKLIGKKKEFNEDSITYIKSKYNPNTAKFNEKAYNRLSKSEILKAEQEAIKQRTAEEESTSAMIRAELKEEQKQIGQESTDTREAVEESLEKAISGTEARFGDSLEVAQPVKNAEKKIAAVKAEVDKILKGKEVTLENYEKFVKLVQNSKAIKKLSANNFEATMVAEQIIENLAMQRPYDADILYHKIVKNPSKPLTYEEVLERFDKLDREIKELLGDNVSVELGKTPAGTGGYTMFLSNGKVKIRINPETARENTFNEERFHALFYFVADTRAMEGILKKYGWDGKGKNKSWVDANEALYKAYRAFVQGYGGKTTLFERVKETFRKISNWLKGNGFWDEGEFFRKFAEGKVEFRKNVNRNENRSTRLNEWADNVVRAEVKSINFINDNETVRIDDVFWRRLKNKGVKDVEIEYLKHSLTEGEKLKGDELKLKILENLYPIKIKRLEEGVYGQVNTRPRTDYKEFSIMGRGKGQGVNYGIWSFDLPFGVKQVHDYWSRPNSMGWFRGYEEANNIEGKLYPTGVFNVNEIQSQLQYTKAPKWEDLKVGDEIKLGSDKWKVDAFYKTNTGENAVNLLPRNESAVDGMIEGVKSRGITENTYKEKANLGEQPEFLQSLQPHWEQLMVRSIIQWAADNGYKAVRFPTKESISTIEGFDKLQEEIKVAEAKVKGDLEQKEQFWNIWDSDGRREWRKKHKSNQQHLKDLQNALQGNAYPVIKFYEESVGMYGRKYRGDNWDKVRDAYGNEWFETSIKHEDKDAVLLFDKLNRPETADPKDQLDRFDTLIDWNNSEKAFDLREGRMEKLFNSPLAEKFGFAGKKASKYWHLSIPPAYARYKMKKFAPIREIGETEIVRKSTEIMNKIIREEWNDGKYFGGLDKDIKQGLMDAIAKYSDDMYNGRHDRQLTTDEFIKEYKLDEAQAKVVRMYQNAVERAIEVARDGWFERLFELTDDVASYLSKRELKTFFSGYGITTVGKANEMMKNDPALKEQVARYLADKIFAYEINVGTNENPKWEKPFYFNSVRPSTPNTWIVEMTRASDGKRISTYADTKQDAQKIIDKWMLEGYTVDKDKDGNTSGFYRIGDIIAEGEYWNRLTEQQLINLANAGHIDLNENVIKRLRDAIKSGTFKQHGINKEFIPGLHHSFEEYEKGLYSFVSEAVFSNYRHNALTKIKKMLNSWQTELTAQLKDPELSAAKKEELRTEWEYANGYVNNLTYSDKNFMDGYRGFTMSVYTSMKLSFLFQQLMQPIQTTWAILTGEKGKNKDFFGAFNDAFNLIKQLNAIRKGVSANFVSDEVIEVYNRLNDMRKLGAVGIKELTNQGGSLEYRYAAGNDKIIQGLIRASNVASGSIEKFTRLQAMNAFYRLGKEKKLSGDELINFIADKIDESMSQFGVGGRAPLFARHKMGVRQESILKAIDKSFMTLKTFATHNLGLYEKLFREKQWGVLGIKLAVGTGMHGITKFPLMALGFALANLFTDEDIDYEVAEAIQSLNDLTGTPIGSLLRRGVGTFAGIDASNLFAEGTIVPFDDFYSANKGKSAIEKVADEMFGAPYGLAQDIIASADGAKKLLLNEISNDESLTAAEKSSAKKNIIKIAPLWLRNVVNGMKMSTDGIELRGKQILKADDLDWYDVTMKIAGFQPLNVAEAYEEQFQGIVAKFARINGKIEKLKKIRKEIRASKEYTPESKEKELRWIAEELRKTQQDRSAMIKTSEWREAYKAKLVKP